MGALYEVLPHFPIVFAFFLCEVVDSVGFLEQRIAFILLVFKDAAHCADGPVLFARWRRYTVFCQMPRNPADGFAFQEKAVD